MAFLHVLLECTENSLGLICEIKGKIKKTLFAVMICMGLKELATYTLAQTLKPTELVG